ncbi:hypothetical protein L1887_22471 [Cichorium endivia]|nr:hypothetical protein L1887_22471 [Cichorium endivia]
MFDKTKVIVQVEMKRLKDCIRMPLSLWQKEHMFDKKLNEADPNKKKPNMQSEQSPTNNCWLVAQVKP